MNRAPSSYTRIKGESGAAVLPIIIGIAVAITLLQVPLLYKTKSGNAFSGAQKTNISAKSLAEAGIDGVISDIGRKAIHVSLATDTTPYAGATLGRGTYTTHIKGYQINPDRVEVVSTGRIGATTQSVRARMELVKTLTTIPFDTPKISLWGIRGTPPTLYYHSLDERDSGHAWVHPEGQVIAEDGATLAVDDFTVAPNGTMYFINNINGQNSTLYKIRPIDLDNNPATPVYARLVGPTGLRAGSDSTIRGLTFIAHDTTGRNGVLYAVTWKSKQVFELSLQDGKASFVSDIVPKTNPADPYIFDAMTQDLVGTIYIVRNVTSGGPQHSELWRFDEFVEIEGARTDSISKVCNISNTKTKTRALAGHPNGYIYATDDASWYKINPSLNQSVIMFTDSSNLQGMGFHFEREDLKFTGKPIAHKINICHYPPGNCANFHTIQIDSSALNAHMHHGGSNACAQDTPGYCTFGESVTSINDTTIQLRIISWEEFTGEALAAH